MAAETLTLTGPQCPQGRVQGYELRVGRKLVAGVTVELLFIRQRLQVVRSEPRRHSTQSDLDIIGEMATLLGARRVGGLKPMGCASVTGQAGHVLQGG